MDFCVFQRTLLASWTPSEAPLYEQLQQLVLSLLAFPRLAIGDLAVDALPTVFPDVSRNDCRAVARSAEAGVERMLGNLLGCMQTQNPRHPQFQQTQ